MHGQKNIKLLLCCLLHSIECD